MSLRLSELLCSYQQSQNQSFDVSTRTICSYITHFVNVCKNDFHSQITMISNLGIIQILAYALLVYKYIALFCLH